MSNRPASAPLQPAGVQSICRVGSRGQSLRALETSRNSRSNRALILERLCEKIQPFPTLVGQSEGLYTQGDPEKRDWNTLQLVINISSYEGGVSAEMVPIV